MDATNTPMLVVSQQFQSSASKEGGVMAHPQMVRNNSSYDNLSKAAGGLDYHNSANAAQLAQMSQAYRPEILYQQKPQGQKSQRSLRPPSGKVRNQMAQGSTRQAHD